MNNKGQLVLTKEMPKIIFYSVFVIIVILTIFLIFAFFAEIEFIKKIPEDHIPINMFLASKECLAYESNDRVYPGIIDYDKFNEERLNRCFHAGFRNKQGIKLSLYSLNGYPINENLEINKEITPWELACDLTTSNFRCYRDSKYVLYVDNELKKGRLDFVVITEDE